MKKLGKYRVKDCSPKFLILDRRMFDSRTLWKSFGTFGEHWKFERLSPREISRRQKSASVRSNLNRTSSAIPFQSRNTRNQELKLWTVNFYSNDRPVELKRLSGCVHDRPFSDRLAVQFLKKAHWKQEHFHRVLVAGNLQLDVGVFFAINLWIWYRWENDRFATFSISRGFCDYFSEIVFFLLIMIGCQLIFLT